MPPSTHVLQATVSSYVYNFLMCKIKRSGIIWRENWLMLLTFLSLAIFAGPAMSITLCNVSKSVSMMSLVKNVEYLIQEGLFLGRSTHLGWYRNYVGLNET